MRLLIFRKSRSQSLPTISGFATPKHPVNIFRLLRSLILAALCLPAYAQQEAVPFYKAIDSVEARMQGCVTCHGQSGQGTNNGYFPRIAGKPAAYLYNQLVAFRDGVRKYPPMNYLVAYLPDAYLREMAEHFSKLRPEYSPRDATTMDANALARGKAIATSGDAAKQIPACIACHGASLTGMNPGIPGLVGLRATYIAAQLTRWRVGDRGTVEPDCMKRIAARLSESDVGAVSAYLAQQQVPAGASPESPNLVRMPFACGTQR